MVINNQLTTPWLLNVNTRLSVLYSWQEQGMCFCKFTTVIKFFCHVDKYTIHNLKHWKFAKNNNLIAHNLALTEILFLTIDSSNFEWISILQSLTVNVLFRICLKVLVSILYQQTTFVNQCSKSIPPNELGVAHFYGLTQVLCVS